MSSRVFERIENHLRAIVEVDLFLIRFVSYFKSDRNGDFRVNIILVPREKSKDHGNEVGTWLIGQQIV